MSNMPEKLPQNVEREIFLFAKEMSFYPKLLGRKIFDIIEEECVVVFYPIMDAEEKNDGFFLPSMPLQNGECKNIIYINTFQTEEKQVFIAAHEFGHYLKVSDIVNKKCCTAIDSERIVNRFAAEILMPTDLFKEYFVDTLKKNMGKTKACVGLNMMIRCIVSSMDHFRVPYNSVVIRLVETGLIRREDGIKLVDGFEQLSLEDISNIVDRCIVDGDYGALRTSSHKKDIRGLKALLDEAEKRGNVSNVKLERLRKEFGIVATDDNVLEEEIRIAEGE